MAGIIILLLCFIFGAVPTASVYAINTVQTDVILGASGPEIRIWGQVDSYTECSNIPQATSPGIIPLIVIPGIDDVGHTNQLDGNYIPWGTYFDITLTTENLYNTGQLPYSLETGVTGDQDVWQVATMQVNPTGTDWATECDYLVGDWSETVFTLNEYVAPGGGGGGTFTPLTFSLLPTTTEPTDLIASVAGGVQTTGKAIWPMFAFVGVSLAFVIALQVVVFIKRSTHPEKRGTGDPNAPKRKPRRNSRGQFIKDE